MAALGGEADIRGDHAWMLIFVEKEISHARLAAICRFSPPMEQGEARWAETASETTRSLGDPCPTSNRPQEAGPGAFQSVAGQ